MVKIFIGFVISHYKSVYLWCDLIIRLRMKKVLEKLFNDNKGYLTTAQMRGSALRYHLNKMMASGQVYKVRHGLYVHTDYQQYDERVMVAEIVPSGIFCLFTAWHIYELTTTVNYQYHMAVPRSTKINPAPYPPVALYYLSDKVYNLGIVEIQLNDNIVKCYDKERSVCDAVKFRNKTGEDIMQEVIKNYMKMKDKNIDVLLKYARILRVEKLILPYLKALI